MASIEIKEKHDGRWRLLPLERVAGKTLGEALLDWHGKEVVMRFEHNGRTAGIICGTDHWLNRYREMGNEVCTAQEAYNMIADSPNFDVLDEPMLPDGIENVFEGEVARIEFAIPDNIFSTGAWGS